MNAERSRIQRGSRSLLFSGHMVDSPERETPRFPQALEWAVEMAIRAEVKKLRAGPADCAIASGACGGDILFVEAVLDRGVPVRLYLPFDEPTFLEKSIYFANELWADRYHAVAAQSTRFIAPDLLGPLPEGTDPFERTNLWMLDEARRISGHNVVFVCLWNGKGGDGPGGTKQVMTAVREAGGKVQWIDIRKLEP